MAYWCVARSEPNREATAVHFLDLAGYATYLPRIREQRTTHGRRYVVTPALFPNYLFARIERGWWRARWSCGVTSLIMAGEEPAKVADAVIDGIKCREHGGFVVLPEAPRLRPGDPVRVVHGPLEGCLGLYAGMRGAERVALLLALLGAQRLTVLPAASVEPAR